MYLATGLADFSSAIARRIRFLFWFVFASLWSPALALALIRKRCLFHRSCFIFTSLRPPWFSLRRLLGLWDQLQFLKDLPVGRIHPDQLPVAAVCTCLLGPSEHRHDLFIGVVFQQIRLVKGLYEPEGKYCGKKITELTSYNRIVILHPGLVELACGFVKPHYDLDLPALFISLISCFRRQIEVTLKDDGPKGLLLLPESFQTVGLIFLCPPEPVTFLFGSLVTVSEGIQPFICPAALFFPEGNTLLSRKDTGKVQHVMPLDQL